MMAKIALATSFSTALYSIDYDGNDSMSDKISDLNRLVFGMVLNFCIGGTVLTLLLIMAYWAIKDGPQQVCESLPKFMGATNRLSWILIACGGYQATNLGLKGRRRGKG